MYTLCTGVNYTQGSMSLDDVKSDNISDIALAIAKIMQEEVDAINFVFTVSINQPEAESTVAAK